MLLHRFTQWLCAFIADVFGRAGVEAPSSESSSLSSLGLDRQELHTTIRTFAVTCESTRTGT